MATTHIEWTLVTEALPGLDVVVLWRWPDGVVATGHLAEWEQDKLHLDHDKHEEFEHFPIAWTSYDQPTPTETTP